MGRVFGVISTEMGMSGPIVRTGATPEYWNNWDSVFGKKPRQAAEPAAAAPAGKKKVAGKSATKSPAKAKKVAPAAKPKSAKAGRKKKS